MCCYLFLKKKGAYLYTLFGDKFELICVNLIKICVNRLCYIFSPSMTERTGDGDI